MSLSTPVAFLIFNRPEYTEKVFKAIAQAKPQKLLVIADGPRASVPEDINNCQKTRAIINNIDWECELLTNFAENNLGLRLRISSGLDWVFSHVEEAIILEDDCLPHPSFFDFCSNLLEKYRYDERIMTISGSNFLLDKLTIDESYTFSRFFVMWGWASWRRAWEKYDITMEDWKVYKLEKQIEGFFAQKHIKEWLTQLFDFVYEKQHTWDIQWFYSCLFSHGLTIIPKKNLISNIGFIGVHSTQKQGLHELPLFALDTSLLKHPNMMFQNQVFESKMFELFNASPPNQQRTIIEKIKDKLRKIKYKLKM